MTERNAQADFVIVIHGVVDDDWTPPEARHLAGQHDQKSHGRSRTRGVTGMGDLSEGLQKKVNGQVEKLWGVSEAEAREMAVQNMVAVAERAPNLDAREWYHEANRISTEIGDQYGFSTEEVAGAISATSAQLDWDVNVKVATGISKVMGEDRPFDIDQGMIDDYNAYVGKRTRSSPMFQEIDIEPGTYRPSDLPEGFLVGQHPEMPRIRNGEGTARAILILRGENPANVLQGPKQRSFINNIVEPGASDTATMDTWHYQAAAGDHLFTAKKAGVTRSLTIGDWRSPAFHRNEFGLDEAASRKAARSPQDFFQGAPSSKAETSFGPDGYQNNGVYPWFVDRTKEATALFNQRNGTDLNPSEFQAVVWIQIRGEEG